MSQVLNGIDKNAKEGIKIVFERGIFEVILTVKYDFICVFWIIYIK